MNPYPTENAAISVLLAHWIMVGFFGSFVARLIGGKWVGYANQPNSGTSFNQIKNESKKTTKTKNIMSDQNKNKRPTAEQEKSAKDSLDRLQEKNPDTEYEITAEDKRALGPKGLSMDGGDDEELLRRKRKVDFAGEDLDIPGSELDDAQEARGSEDEENNHYSLGSDQNEDLERE